MQQADIIVAVTSRRGDSAERPLPQEEERTISAAEPGRRIVKLRRPV